MLLIHIGLNWLQCFYHVDLIHAVGHEDTSNTTFIYQAHPSTCALTTPRPRLLLLHRRGRVLPSIPKHPRQFKVEVLAMVLSYLNSMQLVYVTSHRMASQYNLPNYTNQQFLQVWKPWLINFQPISQLVDTIFKSNSNERYIFPTSTVLPEWILHMVVFCAPPLHNSLNSSFVWPFTGSVMSLSCACGHQITCLMQLGL